MLLGATVRVRRGASRSSTTLAMKSSPSSSTTLLDPSSRFATFARVAGSTESGVVDPRASLTTKRCIPSVSSASLVVSTPGRPWTALRPVPRRVNAAAGTGTGARVKGVKSGFAPADTASTSTVVNDSSRPPPMASRSYTRPMSALSVKVESRTVSSTVSSATLRPSLTAMPCGSMLNVTSRAPSSSRTLTLADRADGATR